MAKVTIGDKEYDVPELNFIALERAWPHVELTLQQLNPMVACAAGIAIIAAGLQEAEHFVQTEFGMLEHEVWSEGQVFVKVQDFLKKKLKSSQLGNIRECIEKILEETGVFEERKAGDPPPPAGSETQDQNPSTATAPDTSKSL